MNRAAFGLPSSQVALIANCFNNHHAIEQVIIYGSRAMNTHGTGSDIDLTIIGDLPANELQQLETELDDLMLPYKIDLSVLSQITNQDLLDHIGRVGKSFFEKVRRPPATSTNAFR